MARSRIFDPFLTYRFHVFEVSWNPLSQIPALNPVAGFKSVTVPEITVDVAEYEHGTANRSIAWPTKYAVGTVTLSRGATLASGDFWRWILATVTGAQGGGLELSGARKDLMIVLLTDIGSKSAELPAGLAQLASAISGGSVSGSVPLTYVPGKAWLLRGCFPVRFRSSGDLDAQSAEVAIEELELRVTEFEEVLAA